MATTTTFPEGRTPSQITDDRRFGWFAYVTKGVKGARRLNTNRVELLSEEDFEDALDEARAWCNHEGTYAIVYSPTGEVRTFEYVPGGRCVERPVRFRPVTRIFTPTDWKRSVVTVFVPVPSYDDEGTPGRTVYPGRYPLVEMNSDERGSSWTIKVGADEVTIDADSELREMTADDWYRAQQPKPQTRPLTPEQRFLNTGDTIGDEATLVVWTNHAGGQWDNPSNYLELTLSLEDVEYLIGRLEGARDALTRPGF